MTYCGTTTDASMHLVCSGRHGGMIAGQSRRIALQTSRFLGLALAFRYIQMLVLGNSRNALPKQQPLLLLFIIYHLFAVDFLTYVSA